LTTLKDVFFFHGWCNNQKEQTNAKISMHKHKEKYFLNIKTSTLL
jgi:hypothetical protein